MSQELAESLAPAKQDLRNSYVLVSVSDSGPPKRPESFLFISLNILKQFIEIRYVLLT